MYGINSGITSSSMVSFADDTRLYYGISNVDDCAILLNDLNSIYEWVSGNNIFFNAQTFQYICFNPHTSLSCNVYTSSSLDIIDYSRHVLDLGIYVSSDCFSNFILLTSIKELNINCLDTDNLLLSDKLTMLTLFKALVVSQLDYGSQFWSPYLTKHINIIKKTQQSLTRHISGMQDLSYSERLPVLKIYSLQCRRERYIII